MLTDDGSSRPAAWIVADYRDLQLLGDGDRPLFVGTGQGDDELVSTDASGHTLLW